MFIKFLAFVIFILFLLSPIIGGEIKPENRVSNLNVGMGVCWFACVDMVAREYNIINAIGIRDNAVNIDKVGTEAGCHGIHMLYYRLKYKFNITFLDNYNYKQLYKWIEEGKTPIVNLYWGKMGHSVVLIKAQTEEDGKSHFYVVNPNHPETVYKHSKEFFETSWMGTAQLISE